VALTIIVLAAGQGKRMNSDIPKVLQPLAGRGLLAHVLATARTLEPSAINVVYGHGGEAVRQAHADPDLSWSLQSEQLGTGDAVARALPSVPDGHQVLVLCGDVPLVKVESLRRLLAAAGQGAALLTAVVDDPGGYGRIKRDGESAVIGIVEERESSAEERSINEINTGLMALPAGRLKSWLGELTADNAQGEFYLTDVIAMAVRDGVSVAGIAVEDPSEALGVNDRAQLAEAERVLRQRSAAALMAQGATLADPARFDLRGELTVGRDVFIDVGAVFTGKVELGDRVHVGPNAVLSDTRLADDCRVHAHSVLDGVIAGPHCDIGPYARLRPGTELAARVKVGNFVEVKASQVAEGSKMNHLSYIGDSSVGRDVNIGAGTITCNYDGARKHRTTVGDKVFVGSGVMIVAPVELGEGATIAAGSTVTKDAPPGELTIARTRQTSVKGWKRPKKPAK